MTTERPVRVSVIDPISPAIEHVKTILFKPFDIGRWFAIGFCAWLAYLGRGGGYGGNINIPTGHDPTGFHQARDFLLQNAHWIIPLIIAGFVVGVALWVLLIWLSSRGKFMFLHCVVTNTAEVKNPWRKFSRQGNSLFVFRLVAGLICFLCLVLLAGSSIILIVLCVTGRIYAIVPAVVALIFLVPVTIAGSIAVALLFKFTDDFVVPIMFLSAARCTDAWGKFLQILSVNKARFLLYILFQIAIATVIGAIVAAAVCLTCCCAACILTIPYIGTVLLLPLLVFSRSYSLLYLRQFGPAFDVFAYQIGR